MASTSSSPASSPRTTSTSSWTAIDAASATLPLVVVGSAPYADAYTDTIRGLADDRVRLVGGVWDQELLDQLYARCLTYLHGHSVGGTNPSLLRAIGAGAATTAYDVSFNREVLLDSGRFFSDAEDVRREIERAEQDPVGTAARGAQAQELAHRYNWDDVAERYEALAQRLVDQRGRRPRRPSGRRR